MKLPHPKPALELPGQIQGGPRNYPARPNLARGPGQREGGPPNPRPPECRVNGKSDPPAGTAPSSLLSSPLGSSWDSHHFPTAIATTTNNYTLQSASFASPHLPFLVSRSLPLDPHYQKTDFLHPNPQKTYHLERQRRSSSHSASLRS
jgi:hypothetical protein